VAPADLAEHEVSFASWTSACRDLRGWFPGAVSVRVSRLEMNPSRIFFDPSAPSLIDPTPAPQGCHVIPLSYAPTPARYRTQWTKDRQEYERMKESLADVLLRAAKRAIPGLKDHVIVQDTVSPRTYERYTLSEGLPPRASPPPSQPNAFTRWKWYPICAFGVTQTSYPPTRPMAETLALSR